MSGITSTWTGVFFFQAEDGIRDRSPSRGLGDVYKRQLLSHPIVRHERQFIFIIIYLFIIVIFNL